MRHHSSLGAASCAQWGRQMKGGKEACHQSGHIANAMLASVSLVVGSVTGGEKCRKGHIGPVTHIAHPLLGLRPPGAPKRRRKCLPVGCIFVGGGLVEGNHPPEAVIDTFVEFFVVTSVSRHVNSTLSQFHGLEGNGQMSASLLILGSGAAQGAGKDPDPVLGRRRV